MDCVHWIPTRGHPCQESSRFISSHQVWKHVYARVHHDEPLLLLEGRAALSSVMRIRRGHFCHHNHRVLVGDNLRTRCCVCQRDFVPNHRWILSELNRADQQSRLGEPPVARDAKARSSPWSDGQTKKKGSGDLSRETLRKCSEATGAGEGL